MLNKCNNIRGSVTNYLPLSVHCGPVRPAWHLYKNKSTIS